MKLKTLTSDQSEEKNPNDIHAPTGHSSKHRGPDDEDEDRKGETGLRKPNANAPGPGKHPEDTKGEVIAEKHQRGKDGKRKQERAIDLRS